MDLRRFFTKVANELDFLVRQAEGRTSIHLFEWLQYWFSGTSNTDMVMDTMLPMYLQKVLEYGQAYLKALKVPENRDLESVKADLDLLKSMNDNELSQHREKLQELFLKYAPQYVLKEDLSGYAKIIKVDKYSVGGTYVADPNDVVSEYSKLVSNNLEKELNRAIAEAHKAIDLAQIDLQSENLGEFIGVQAHLQFGVSKTAANKDEFDLTDDVWDQLEASAPEDIEGDLVVTDDISSKPVEVGVSLKDEMAPEQPTLAPSSQINVPKTDELLSRIKDTYGNFNTFFKEFDNVVDHTRSDVSQILVEASRNNVDRNELSSRVSEAVKPFVNMAKGLDITVPQNFVNEIIQVGGLDKTSLYSTMSNVIQDLVYAQTVSDGQGNKQESKIKTKQEALRKAIQRQIDKIKKSLEIAENTALPLEDRFLAIGWILGYHTTDLFSGSGDLPGRMGEFLKGLRETPRIISEDIETPDGKSYLDVRVVVEDTKLVDIKNTIVSALTLYFERWDQLQKLYSTSIEQLSDMIESSLEYIKTSNEGIQEGIKKFSTVIQNTERLEEYLKPQDLSVFDDYINDLETRIKNAEQFQTILSEAATGGLDKIQTLDAEFKKVIPYDYFGSAYAEILNQLYDLKKEINASGVKNPAIFAGLGKDGYLQTLDQIISSFEKGAPDLDALQNLKYNIEKALGPNRDVPVHGKDVIPNIERGKTINMVKKFGMEAVKKYQASIRDLKIIKATLQSVYDQTNENFLVRSFKLYNIWNQLKPTYRDLFSDMRLQKYSKTIDGLLSILIKNIRDELTNGSDSILQLLDSSRKNLKGLQKNLKEFSTTITTNIKSITSQLNVQSDGLVKLVESIVLPKRSALMSENFLDVSVFDELFKSADATTQAVFSRDSITPGTFIGYGELIRTTIKMLDDCEKSLKSCIPKTGNPGIEDYISSPPEGSSFYPTKIDAIDVTMGEDQSLLGFAYKPALSALAEEIKSLTTLFNSRGTSDSRERATLEKQLAYLKKLKYMINNQDLLKKSGVALAPQEQTYVEALIAQYEMRKSQAQSSIGEKFKSYAAIREMKERRQLVESMSALK